MTDRKTLLALAERCEQATGPDRALDFMILKRVRGLRDLGCGLYEMGNWYYALNDDDPSEKHPPFPSPTASLDAALALVPDGHDWRIEVESGRQPGAICCHPDQWSACPGVTMYSAATPALALCAAALRARAEEVADE